MKLANRLKTYIRRLDFSHRFGTDRYCPVCRKSSAWFLNTGREDARCLRCGSLERHRLLWLYINRRTNLFCHFRGGETLLHVAPEKCLRKLFANRFGSGYLTADLSRRKAMVEMDITQIDYPDESFDYIYCSHVLEHVSDDRKAMREFHRVLKRNGWAILLVPIADRTETYEDPSIVAPKERLQAFGQKDHVRLYGSDYIDRLTEAGFKVTKTTVTDLVNQAGARIMGLTPASGEIYFCTR